MRRDRFGLVLSTCSDRVVDAIDHFAHELLSHGKGASEILDAAAIDPDAPLVNAYCAAMYLFLQSADGRRRAAPWLERARLALEQAGVEQRERELVAALEAWYRGDVALALQRHIGIAQRWPRDLVNAKIAQVHQLGLGQRRGMRDLAEYTVSANPASSYAWGMLAFALEQVGELPAALASGQHAVSLNRDDPWAQHAVAHVHEARGAADEGIAWLAPLADSWQRCSSFMLTHNWWHLALFHLRRDDAPSALALYDRYVWGVRKTHVQDQVNAVSLLGRLEQAGVDVGHRWLDVAAHAMPRIDDRQNPFLDLHFGYALARAGEDAAVDRLLAGVLCHARRSASPLWREVALPALRGVIAHARGRYRDAAQLLASVATRLHLVGGSTAQHAWFTRMQLDATRTMRPHRGAMPAALELAA